jgi:hypothetical protein
MAQVTRKFTALPRCKKPLGVGARRETGLTGTLERQIGELFSNVMDVPCNGFYLVV